MRLELKDIKDSGLLKDLVCTPAEFPVLMEMEQRAEAHFNQPILFRLCLQKTGQLVEVNGRISTSVLLSCGHCLHQYEEKLVGDFVFTFTPYLADDQVAVDEDVEIELETDELGLVYYKDECLDLFQPLQDQLTMALPISPICKDDCKGLCSECGCNLNSNSCDCVKKPFNSKFMALAGIRVNASGE